VAAPGRLVALGKLLGRAVPVGVIAGGEHRRIRHPVEQPRRRLVAGRAAPRDVARARKDWVACRLLEDHESVEIDQSRACGADVHLMTVGRGPRLRPDDSTVSERVGAKVDRRRRYAVDRDVGPTAIRAL
jgi:hypothetical protein